MGWQLISFFLLQLSLGNAHSQSVNDIGETVERSQRRLSQIERPCNPKAYNFSEPACQENNKFFTSKQNMSGGKKVDEPPSFMMSIQVPKKVSYNFGSCYEHICSGVLIAPNQVLTAAHCLQDFKWKIDKHGYIDARTELYVAQAPLCRHQTGQKRLPIRRTFIHPDFNWREFQNYDVAILEVSGAFDGEYIDYQSAYNLSVEDVELQLFGYGKSGVTDKYYSRIQLKSINFTNIDDDFCRYYISTNIKHHYKPDIMLCTFNPKGKGCEGDSGGPLILNQTNINKEVVVGINSWGNHEDCNSIFGPTIFTRIGSPNIVFWIDEIVQNYGKVHGPVQWEKPIPLEGEDVNYTYPIIDKKDKNDNLPSALRDLTDRSAPLDCSLAGSIECDLQALLFIKSKLEPSAKQFYSSWSGSNPCDRTWINVYCKHVSHEKQLRVTKLLLGSGYYYQRGWYWYYRKFPQSVKFLQRLPVELTKMQWMEQLQLHFAEFSGSIFPEISTMKNLTVLTMGYSYITGILPVEISQLSRLKVVDLSSNQIMGTLPPGISKWSQIELFDVDGNYISGTLPPQISEFSRMTVLALSYNQIYGSIPPQISNLSRRLYGMNLSYNQFTGTLPPQISVVSSLNRIQCQVNQITGTVPPEYSVLSKTKILVFPQHGDLCLERKYESIVNDTEIVYC